MPVFHAAKVTMGEADNSEGRVLKLGESLMASVRKFDNMSAKNPGGNEVKEVVPLNATENTAGGAGATEVRFGYCSTKIWRIVGGQAVIVLTEPPPISTRESRIPKEAKSRLETELGTLYSCRCSMLLALKSVREK